MQVQSKFQKEKEEEIFEEIIAENFLKLMTDTKPQKQAPQKHHGGKIPCMCTHTHRHTVLKQLTTENKVSNAVGENETLYTKEQR